MKDIWWFGLVVCPSLLWISLAASTSTITPNSVVPLEFPTSNQNYTFVDNSSIRENLASHSEIDTEVDDLLGLDEPQLTVVPNPSEEDEISLKNDTELIENGDNTEDDKFKTEVVTNGTTVDGGDVGPLDGRIAAILVGAFLVVCVAGYVALMLWRRYLEMRYGSREMLVTDEFMDPDDMKHFSI